MPFSSTSLSTVAALVVALSAAGCGSPSSTTGSAGTAGTGGTGGTGAGGTATGGTATGGSTGGTATGGTGTGGSTGGTATGGSTGGTGGGAAAVQDILTTDITLDVATLMGAAKIVVQPDTATSTITLEVKGLTLGDVKVGGAAADYKVTDGIAVLNVKDPFAPATVDITYSFKAQPSDGFNGWMPKTGATFLWPYFCSNLFPCNSYPDDGVLFSMNVTGYDPKLIAVYPKTTTGDSPSYMPAVAVGDYTVLDLGTTKAGTKLTAWHLPGQQSDAAAGTKNLKAVYDFYETTYGPYSFGKEAGTVSVDWGPGDFGGMEHHPFVHVGKNDFKYEDTQAHEAAHAWYGDGVRIACWEDFVLSEGTVTYMAAHSLEKVGGPSSWPDYVASLDAICTGMDTNTIALPDTCNVIDLLNDPLWSNVPYMKGACFYEDVADLIGQDVVDTTLGEFYKANVGKPATMKDMIAALESKATVDQKTTIETYVQEWLLQTECPKNYATRCGTHQKQ